VTRDRFSGLWPVFEGTVRRPEDAEIMFLPQRPYLSSGSLRDQVIYPHSYPDYLLSGKTDADLLKIMERAHLGYIPDREGGLDARKEWKDLLSGGEKQRVRLFPHLRHNRIVIEKYTLHRWEWLVSSTTSQNSPFWTNALLLFRPMLKARCINTPKISVSVRVLWSLDAGK